MYTGPLFRVIPCPVCGCRVFQFKNSEPLLDLFSIKNMFVRGMSMNQNDIRFRRVQCFNCRAAVFQQQSTGLLFDSVGRMGWVKHICMKQKCFPVRKNNE